LALNSGFYYSRYSTPRDCETLLTARNQHHQVWYHRVGTAQSADTLVYEDPSHPLYLHLLTTTEDERFAVLSVLNYADGWSGNALFVAALDVGRLAFTPVVDSFEDEFGLVDSYRGKLLVLTSCKAPNRRLVLVDPANSRQATWKTVISEADEVLESVRPVGRRLFATYAHGGSHQLRVFSRNGDHEYNIPLPEAGSVTVIGGGRRDMEVLWTFSSFTIPTTIHSYNIARRSSSVYRKPQLAYDIDRYETTRVMYQAQDGVAIPMFIVHAKGLRLDGKNPLLLQGYGGFGISVSPSFDPLLIALLERGVVYATPCIRGGGEYGEAWHRAGQREKKQVVFNDFIAAAEWLQVHRYTSPATCALHGVSNGGLLVSAVLTQRPDLLRVALPVGGVMDMLRFQEFTMGWAWVAEYGSREEAQMFPVLLGYSPLHNVKDGVSYPATLVVTSEHDDSVVPAHSFKFVATLQGRGAGPGPYLIRIETKSGHAPVNLSKALDERADLYAFLLAHLSATHG
jgi:prolyl oligopeptidase